MIFQYRKQFSRESFQLRIVRALKFLPALSYCPGMKIPCLAGPGGIELGSRQACKLLECLSLFGIHRGGCNRLGGRSQPLQFVVCPAVMLNESLRKLFYSLLPAVLFRQLRHFYFG